MHKTVEQHKKQNGELQKQVEELRQLVGERDAEVRDLAYKDLLPDQILRAQHALQALQDHLTEQHMRQLLGSEPLQAILGVICQKEQLQQQRKQHNDNAYYIQMIDSMDPVAALQQPEATKEEGKEKTEEDTTGEAALQKQAKEIMAAMLQRKQQHRQQQPRLTTTYKDNNDNNDDNGKEGEGSTTRRRVETPRRQDEDTTTTTEMAIVEREERGILQVRKRRRRFVVATTTILACLSTVTTSLSHIVFATLPFVAQHLQVAYNYLDWRQVERLQLVYNYGCQAGNYYRSYYRSTLESYYNMTATTKEGRGRRCGEGAGYYSFYDPTSATCTKAGPLGGLARRQELPH